MAKLFFSPVYSGMHLPNVTIMAAGLLLPLLFFSCSMKRTAEAPPIVDLQVIERKTNRIAQLEMENAQLADQLLEQKLLSQKLQTALLLRHKETDACLQANEKLETELKQSRAKLANRNSRLGAVTCIAEATAVISSVARQSLDDRQAILHKRANQNLNTGKHELEKGNYEAAFLLCRKAIEQARSIDLDKDTTSAPSVQKEISFSTPLQMEVFITGNLRSSPSIKAEIKTVLPAGTRVIAIGFQRNWVKVKSMDPAETGWIHLSLLY